MYPHLLDLTRNTDGDSAGDIFKNALPFQSGKRPTEANCVQGF